MTPNYYRDANISYIGISLCLVCWSIFYWLAKLNQDYAEKQFKRINKLRIDLSEKKERNDLDNELNEPNISIRYWFGVVYLFVFILAK